MTEPRFPEPLSEMTEQTINALIALRQDYIDELDRTLFILKDDIALLQEELVRRKN